MTLKVAIKLLSIFRIEALERLLYFRPFYLLQQVRVTVIETHDSEEGTAHFHIPKVHHWSRSLGRANDRPSPARH